MLAEFSLGIALVTGLVQVLKTAGLPSRLAPLMAVAMGLLLSIIWTQSAEVGEVVTNGLIWGLSAVGLYSGGKNTGQALSQGIK